MLKEHLPTQWNRKVGRAVPTVEGTANMVRLSRRTQRTVGFAAFSFALVFVVWLPLGILGVIPFVLEIAGETRLRVHASASVLCLLIAAWGFWDDKV
jgi:hypothetical protein